MHVLSKLMQYELASKHVFLIIRKMSCWPHLITRYDSSFSQGLTWYHTKAATPATASVNTEDMRTNLYYIIHCIMWLNELALPIPVSGLYVLLYYSNVTLDFVYYKKRRSLGRAKYFLRLVQLTHWIPIQAMSICFIWSCIM